MLLEIGGWWSRLRGSKEECERVVRILMGEEVRM
jgi:hypothetical protein